jgi:peptidylprolyl isomerase
VNTPVRDRSGRGLPPKAERRALGKAAAAKRAAAKRRKKLLSRALGVALAIGAVVGVAALFGAFGTDAAPNPQASVSGTAAPTLAGGIPADADPALRTKPTVTKGSGDLTKLNVTTLVEGKGAAVEAGQQITVNYVGVSYTTGEEFDSSWSRSEPASFSIGTGKVIAGWDQGLVGVKVGSRVQLDIPTDLAYGANAAAEGKPAGPLRFVVDILQSR